MHAVADKTMRETIVVMKKILASFAGASALLPASLALADQPVDWQWRFQEAATPIMEQITWFETYTLWFIVPITLFVLALLAIVIIKFRASANPVALPPPMCPSTSSGRRA